MGKLALLLWLVAIAVANLIVGERISLLAEGVQAGRLGWLSVALAALVVAAAVWATFRWARVRGARPASSAAPDASRRSFLTGSLVSAAGLAATGGALFARVQGWVFVTGRTLGPRVETMAPSSRATWAGSRVQRTRRLGRTGVQVSDICLGSASIDEDAGGEALARGAIARGINYFDTSPDYSNASSERALGKAMAGQRDKMFVATKFCTADGHLPVGSTVEDYVGAVEASLARLQTDHVDLVHVHACNEIARLTDPNLHEAVR